MKKNKSWLLVIGSFLILGGIGLISYDYYSNMKLNNQEEQAIEEFYSIEEIEEDIIEEPQKVEEVKEQVKINYIAVLKIPKINLERGLVDPNSYLNNVNYNLEILDGRSMPDQAKSNLIIAGHSGNSRISFFKNLNKLVISDEIFIDYKPAQLANPPVIVQSTTLPDDVRRTSPALGFAPSRTTQLVKIVPAAQRLTMPTFHSLLR